jgi:serine/threonine-protein kinase RsbW
MALLPAWISGLASRYSLPENLQFVMTLCLEESVSNVIRHGYAGKKDGPIVVRFSMPREGHFEFVVEDEAPFFNPLDAPEPPPIQPQKEIRVGGQGIRLLRRLSSTLAYKATPSGNRLKMTFSTVSSVRSQPDDSRHEPTPIENIPVQGVKSRSKPP